MTEPPPTDPDESGTVDAFGMRRWSAEDSKAMMEQAGFTDVAVTQLPAKHLRLLVVRGIKPA
jgi:hypothetical protein